MERYPDEIILKERRKRREKILMEQTDLEKDLPEQYLQTIIMSDNMTSIKVPAFLKDLPDNLAERKYEYEPRPQVIKSTQSGSIDFTFSLLDVSVKPEELETVFKGCRKAWKRIMPEIIFYGESEEEINGIRVRWMEYSNNSNGGKVYYFIFYAATEYTFVGSMSCPYNKHEVWTQVAKLSMRTLRGKEYGRETAADSAGRQKPDGAGIHETAAGADGKL